MRLDVFLFEKKISKSRANSSNLIKLGAVKVNGEVVLKNSFDINNDDLIEIDNNFDFASLGGIKLAHAINEFKLNISDKICIDIGASNGGFTDVLLKNGASKVYAVDVGECALSDELKKSSKVIVMDKTNARYLTPLNIGEKCNLGVVDVSFISLTQVLFPLMSLIEKGGEIIALIKPQFELSKNELTKNGIVKNLKLYEKVLHKIQVYCDSINLKIIKIIPAPHPFENKNQEYLLYSIV